MHYSFSFLFCKQSKQVANLHLIEIESLRIAYSGYYLGLTTDIEHYCIQVNVILINVNIRMSFKLV